MTERYALLLIGLCAAPKTFAQFPPPAGQPGTTAIAADSSAFVAWATACTVVRGPQDISDPELGLATVGDESSAIGPALTNGVVSLGDGGMATLTFALPITNGPGWDFAVFENSFSDTYLELGFVEVSSNGVDFFRFPATSLTQATIQVDGFGASDATQINNLAGKYRGGFGTPFDLEELLGAPGLDVNNVTHVRIIDVVGCIQDAYATYDHLGNKVNDPWSTPFASSGFDLDAVGVINQLTTGVDEVGAMQLMRVDPNPASEQVRWHLAAPIGGALHLSVLNTTGQELMSAWFQGDAGQRTFDVRGLPTGWYIVQLANERGVVARTKLVVHAH